MTSRRNAPVSEVSSAVPQHSPSPCAAWPSPTYSCAPGTLTGRYTVEPAVSSLQSRLPPYSFRGGMDPCRPSSAAGAVPRMPKKSQIELAAPPRPAHAALPTACRLKFCVADVKRRGAA